MSVNNDKCREQVQEQAEKLNSTNDSSNTAMEVIDENNAEISSTSVKKEIEPLIRMDPCEEVTALKLLDSAKRRHSETEIDNAIVKKSKIDSINEDGKISTNIDSSMDDSCSSKNIASEVDKSVNNPVKKEIKNEEDAETDDLLERLEAIDAKNLRKPDLKLEEIDRTDLEKDDLLKRLEDAENGVEINEKEKKSNLDEIEDELMENLELKKDFTDVSSDSDLEKEILSSMNNEKFLEKNKKTLDENEKTLEKKDKTLEEAQKILGKDEKKEDEKKVKDEKKEKDTDSFEIVKTEPVPDSTVVEKTVTAKEPKKSNSEDESLLIEETKKESVQVEVKLDEHPSILSEDFNLHASETMVIGESQTIEIKNAIETKDTESDDKDNSLKMDIDDNQTNKDCKIIKLNSDQDEIVTNMETNESQEHSSDTENTSSSLAENLEIFLNETTESTNISMLENNDSKININLNQSKIKEKIFSNVLMMNNGSSTPNSNNVSTKTTTTNSFKPFEISSENVSKILENDEKINIDKINVTNVRNNDSTTDDSIGKSTDDSVTDTSDEVKSYAKVFKQCNGLSENDDSELNDNKRHKNSTSTQKKHSNDTINIISLENGSIDSSNEIYNDNSVYEISVWYEENSIRFLSAEKIDKNKKFGRLTALTDSIGTSPSGTDSLSKRSSNGSVNSLGPFTLPSITTATTGQTTRVSLVSSSNSSSGTQKNDGKFAIPALPPKSKYTVKGVHGLCNFMIEHFTKIKQNLKDDSIDEPHSSDSSTPKTKTKNNTNIRKEKLKIDTPITTDDEDIKEKQTKIIKRNVKISKTPIAVANISSKIDDIQELSKIGSSVLARWSDRRYYAGRIIEIKPGNKYVIKFEDNATRTLPYDHIVFGTDDLLPILDQSVHVLIGNDTYECGLVTSYNNIDGIINYNVTTESSDFVIPATDIYLSDEQAKTIQHLYKNDANIKTPTSSSKRGLRKIVTTIAQSSVDKTTRGKRNGRNSPVIQEIQPGTSGANTRKGRRPKRTQQQLQQSTISESDISDILESDSGPESPNSEAVYGVQPELQKTPKESELHKNRIMAEYLGNDKSKYAEDIQGPIPNNKPFFRNKHFILTCTIAMKTPRTTTKLNNDDMKNKYKKFTTAPFFKEHTKKQIEAAGGKVYNHFEDIPKKNYKNCKLIAPHPITTAKYIQCLAADIQAVSHEWIIDCCRQNSLIDFKKYALPSGWSVLEEKYIKWTIGRNHATPLLNQTILLVSQNKDFIELWKRVCTLAGGKIKLIKLPTDLTQGQNGYIVTDDEFPEEIKAIAELFNIPILQTVWIVQSLILGKPLPPDAHNKLSQFQDDDF